MRPPGALSDDDIAAVRVPALHVGGWYDSLLRATLRHWWTAGTAVVPRPAQRLVIGPWTHRLDVAHTSDARGRFPLGTFYLLWITGSAPAGTTCARVFVQGAQRWIEAAHWPNPTDEWILHLGCHSRLVDDPSGQAGADTFRYDPTDPFPSAPRCGGEDPERRSDLQRYSIPALAQPLTISGIPQVELYVRTDQPDTDWIARLLHEDPGGRRNALGWGCVTTEAPGDHFVRIELTPTSATVSPGARLHLEITSSYFPELARSLGGPDRYRGLPKGPTTQTILRGPGVDSRLHLPLADST
ncbi:MAG: CocE/NonD family hydrolase [Actinomycetota bacterium]|nr:CocE/NonD family hydrolase [Actinomycetota bacterium]